MKSYLPPYPHTYILRSQNGAYLFGSLIKHIQSWLRENCRDGFRIGGAINVTVKFRSFSDALAFKLHFEELIIAEIHSNE